MLSLGITPTAFLVPQVFRMIQTVAPPRGAAPRARPTPPPEPRAIGAWTLIGPSLTGREATVCRARPFGRLSEHAGGYAIKWLRPECERDAAAIQRIAREALVGRLVRHVHVAPVLAANITGSPPYLVMPWLSGRTLAAQLTAGRSFTVPEALWITRQAAAGLAALYQAGYRHGDIKPANLFLSPEGHVTVIDLGFARRVDEPAETAGRAIVGTREYFAPECQTAGGKSDIRTDLFSLGLVLAELLFSGNAINDMAAAGCGVDRADEAVRRVRAMIGLPAGLATLVQQLLAHDVLRRVQTPVELVARLTALEIATFSQRGW